MRLELPAYGNSRLAAVVRNIEKDARLDQMLRCVNVNAVDRLGYSDHGIVHSKIVAKMALKILRLLVSGGIVPSVMNDYKGTDKNDAEVIVVLAAFFHDIGMVVHREQHDVYGVSLAQPILQRLLSMYSPQKREIIIAEVLHAMTFHDSAVPPLTIEGGVVRIADGLDMEKGRARIPFNAGKKDIYAVSALAIEGVDVEAGSNNEKTVQIKVRMSNSAGIFQVDELLKRKISISGLADYVHVTAEITGNEKGIIGKVEY